MATLTRGSRRSRAVGLGRTASVREVCLIGPPAGASEVGPGDAISWAGRTYRVVANDGGEAIHVRPDDLEPR
jgi:hypothetical protein